MARRIEVSQNELLDAIRAAREPDYPNAMTTAEIMAALSLTRSQVRTMLARVNAKCVRVRRLDATGRTQWTAAYVLK